MSNQLDPTQPPWTFIWSFTLSSVAGLAALLRTGHEITWRAALSAMLNSGMLGLVIGLTWYKYYKGDEASVYFLLGVSTLSGLGGVSLVDFVLQLFKRHLSDMAKAQGNKNESENG